MYFTIDLFIQIFVFELRLIKIYKENYSKLFVFIYSIILLTVNGQNVLNILQETQNYVITKYDKIIYKHDTSFHLFVSLVIVLVLVLI